MSKKSALHVSPDSQLVKWDNVSQTVFHILHIRPRVFVQVTLSVIKQGRLLLR